MGRKAYITLSVFMVILFFGGCISNLQDYDPISSDEVGIKEFFVLMEDVWNNKDIDKVLALYHNDAKIMNGRERKIFSKKEYAELLKNLKVIRKIKFGIPKMIKFYENKNKSEVDISMFLYVYQVTLKMKLFLVRSGDSWLITERTYTY